MALATEDSAAKFINISTGVPLNCDFPLYVETELEVVYGSQALVAVYNTDYTVELNVVDGYVDFTVTPLASLLTKINALIATPPTSEPETNFVVVRRKLDYTTDTTPQVVRDTTFLSREIDRLTMKIIQLAERLARSVSLPATVVGDLLVEYLIGEPSEGKAPVWRGDKLVAEIDAADIANAQGYAATAEGYAATAEVSKTAAQAAQAAAEAAAALLPLNNFTATSPPTVNDDSADGYSIGSRWVDTTGDLEAWVCADATAGAAQWLPTTLTVDDLGSLAVLNEVAYANIAAAAIGSTAEILTGTASKLANAANLAPLYYGTKLYQTTGTSVTIGTWTTLLFDTEAWDDGNWHSTSSNTDRITFDFTGRVQIIGVYSPNTANNTSYGTRILKNGTVVARRFSRTSDPAAENLQEVLVCEIDVVPNDYIQLQGYNSNATLTSATGISGTTFTARRIK